MKQRFQSESGRRHDEAFLERLLAPLRMAEPPAQLRQAGRRAVARAIEQAQEESPFEISEAARLEHERQLQAAVDRHRRRRARLTAPFAAISALGLIGLGFLGGIWVGQTPPPPAPAYGSGAVPVMGIELGEAPLALQIAGHGRIELSLTPFEGSEPVGTIHEGRLRVRLADGADIKLDSLAPEAVSGPVWVKQHRDE